MEGGPEFMTKFTRIEGSRDILVTNIMFLSNEASRLQEIIFQGISLRWTMAAIIGNSSLIRNVTDFAPIFENRFMDSLLWARKTFEHFSSHALRWAWFTDVLEILNEILSHFSIILNILNFKRTFYLIFV